MNDGHSRRNVLRALAGTGVTIGVAGCTSSIPGVGGDSSDPCDDLHTYIDAVEDEDTDAAVEYYPYEYIDDYSREEAESSIESDQNALGDITVDCEEGDELGEDEIAELENEFDDTEITAARELTLTMSEDGSDDSRENTLTALEFDGDGWYFW